MSTLHEATVRYSSVDVVCNIGIRGNVVSILLAILNIGPHFTGGERVTRSEWLHIAAPLVAVIG